MYIKKKKKTHPHSKKHSRFVCFKYFFFSGHFHRKTHSFETVYTFISYTLYAIPFDANALLSYRNKNINTFSTICSKNIIALYSYAHLAYFRSVLFVFYIHICVHKLRICIRFSFGRSRIKCFPSSLRPQAPLKTTKYDVTPRPHRPDDCRRRKMSRGHGSPPRMVEPFASVT